MTVRHLRIFAAVVDCGTMHAAAQKLYLSQPTITQAIKELEEHYGCLLFERYGRRLMITPAGQELLGHARELLSVYERMERSMKQNAGQKLLRIGATVVLAEQLLVPMVQAFEAQNPEIRVEVLVDNSSVLESRLLSGELDAALLDSAGRSSEVQLRPFLREKLVVAAAPFHPLAQCTAPVTARQLFPAGRSPAAPPAARESSRLDPALPGPALQLPRGIVQPHLHRNLRVLGLKGLHHRHEQLFGRRPVARSERLLPGILLHAALHALVNAGGSPGMAQQLLGLPGDRRPSAIPFKRADTIVLLQFLDLPRVMVGWER